MLQSLLETEERSGQTLKQQLRELKQHLQDLQQQLLLSSTCCAASAEPKAENKQVGRQQLSPPEWSRI